MPFPNTDRRRGNASPRLYKAASSTGCSIWYAGRNASPGEDLLQHLEQQGELVDPDTPESVLLEKERYEDCRMRVMALLSEREWEILQCSLDGMRYQEIAQHLGTTVKAVDSAMQRIRRKMRAVRSTDYFDS